jgi:hypothetical protein
VAGASFCIRRRSAHRAPRPGLYTAVRMPAQNLSHNKGAGRIWFFRPYFAHSSEHSSPQHPKLSVFGGRQPPADQPPLARAIEAPVGPRRPASPGWKQPAGLWPAPPLTGSSASPSAPRPLTQTAQHPRVAGHRGCWCCPGRSLPGGDAKGGASMLLWFASAPPWPCRTPAGWRSRPGHPGYRLTPTTASRRPGRLRNLQVKNL